MTQNTGGISGSRASTEPSGLGPSGFDPGRKNGLPDIADVLAPIRARIAYRNGMAEKLAGIIAKLLNEHEPLLDAEADGDVICVTEKGGNLVFAVTVDPQSSREPAQPNKRAGRNS